MTVFGTSGEVLDWSLVVGGSVVGAVLVIGFIIGFFAWAYPRWELLAQGASLMEGRHKPCCPPGLGCNDESPSRCRRETALSLADPEQRMTLDGLWAKYHEVPPRRFHEREKRRKDFGRMRDNIIAVRLHEAAQEVDDAANGAGQRGLPAAAAAAADILDGPRTPRRERVSGEVL